MSHQKLALVTGSTRGLGLEIAKALAQHNVRVIITGRSRSAVDAALRQLSHDRHIGFDVDFLQENLRQKFIDDLVCKELFPEIIIHNLGGKVIGDAQPLTLKILRESMKVNLEVALALNEKFIPRMVKNSYGRIVHIGSDAGLTGQASPGQAAAKGAINAYVKSAARFYAKFNVMLCAILPTIFEYEGGAWEEKRRTQPEYYAQRLAQMPMGGFPHPAEIACIVADLACSDSMACAGSLIELAAGR